MSKKGQTLRASVREMIYNMIQFCQHEKELKGPIIDLNKVTERVVAMTGLSKSTVTRIKKEGAGNKGVWITPGAKRKGRPKKIDLNEFDKCAIRNIIRHFYSVRNEVPTLRKLHRALKEDLNFSGGLTSLRTVLKQMGYEYKKLESKKKILIEPQSEQSKGEPSNASASTNKLFMPVFPGNEINGYNLHTHSNPLPANDFGGGHGR